MSNEQWLEDGKCSECRRANYCKKPCKPNMRHKERMLEKAIAETFLGKITSLPKKGMRF